MRQTEFEIELGRYALQQLAVGLIGLAITLGLLYLVIRCGVRDGMLDAQRTRRRAHTPSRERGTSTANLPDMRAD